MKTSTAIRRLARRINAVWSELEYAQRRLFEIRTGIPVENDRN